MSSKLSELPKAMNKSNLEAISHKIDSPANDKYCEEVHREMAEESERGGFIPPHKDLDDEGISYR